MLPVRSPLGVGEHIKLNYIPKGHKVVEYDS